MPKAGTGTSPDPHNPSAAHRTALAAVGCPSSCLDAIARYLDLLTVWERRTNLTGVVRDAQERVDLLVRDPLAALSEVEQGPLLDIGSGNGTPGLILAALLDPLPTTLLEPRQRRWAFLREAARAIGRPDVEVLRVRHDGYRSSRPARTITLRGLALPLAEMEPLVESGGRVLVFGGRPSATPGLVSEGQRPLHRSPLWIFRRV